MMIIIVKNEKQKHWSWSQRRASPLDAVADYHDDDDHDASQLKTIIFCRELKPSLKLLPFLFLLSPAIVTNPTFRS